MEIKNKVRILYPIQLNYTIHIKGNKTEFREIKVTYEGLGKIGYVANSSYTVIGESMSAGRLYDKIGDTAYAKVVLVTPAGTICKICKKSLKSEQEETA